MHFSLAPKNIVSIPYSLAHCFKNSTYHSIPTLCSSVLLPLLSCVNSHSTSIRQSVWSYEGTLSHTAQILLMIHQHQFWVTRTGVTNHISTAGWNVPQIIYHKLFTKALFQNRLRFTGLLSIVNILTEMKTHKWLSWNVLHRQLWMLHKWHLKLTGDSTPVEKHFFYSKNKRTGIRQQYVDALVQVQVNLTKTEFKISY